MADPTLDLIVYGATGFTGRLVVQHLADHVADHDPDLRWGVAGRRKDALREVLEATGAGDRPVIVADATDPASLAAMAEQTKAVCTTVGPYATYGSPLVEACATTGTDYCDLTGEPHWMRRMIDAHTEQAEASGARIVHTCGFDSIPSDMGTWFIQQQMHQQHGVYAKRVSGRLKSARGGVSGGTLASMVNLLEEAAQDPEIQQILDDPYALNPPARRNGPAVKTWRLPAHDEDFDAWAAPFVMELVNAKVVRRTNAVLDYPYGRDFTYDEALLTGSGPVSGLLAAGMAAGLGIGTIATRFGPVRDLLKRVVPDPGTGPSERAREHGFWDFRLFAEHPTDPSKSLMARVTGQGDPGYGSTSKMLGQTAVALASGEATVGGGFWTPASALGDGLVERLSANAGVAFELI